MSADEMFEKLGFAKIKDTDVETIYKSEQYAMGEKCTHTFLFAKVGKIVFSYTEERHESCGLGVQELQAINEKCKELGWLDETIN